MIVLREARKAFVMHRPNDLLCRITTLVYLFEKYAIDLAALLGIGFDKLNSKIGARSTIARLRYERNAVREARVALLFCAQRLMESIHHRCDMGRKVACFFQDGSLIRAERNELQCDWKSPL